MKQPKMERFLAHEALVRKIDAEVAEQRREDLSGNTNRSSLIRALIVEALDNRSIRRAPVAMNFRKDANHA